MLTSTTLGRDLLFQMLKHYEVPYVFGNPGTSELPFIDGFPKHAGFEYITALHEANAVGMAMGYARQSGKPGVAILHVAPGLANGMGNIYNAYRAGIPLIVIAGQHHSRLLLEEPVLAGDHVGQVRSMTKWAHEVRHADELPLALLRAFKVAMTPPRGPVFLSIPYDYSMGPAAVERLEAPVKIASGFCAEPEALAAIARGLLEAERPLIVAGDGVGDADALEELRILAECVGAGVLSEAMPTRQNFDSGHRQFLGTLPMASGITRNMLSNHDLIFFVGVSAQAAVAVYDNAGPLVPGGAKLMYLHHNPWEIGKNYPADTGAWGEIRTSLAKLAELAGQLSDSYRDRVQSRLGSVIAKAQERRERLEGVLQQERATGAMSARTVASVLTDLLPRDGRFTVVNEAVSNAGAFTDYMHLWQPKQYTAGKGGGLGHGASQAIGCYLADPDRQIVSICGDGTFLYYPQVLYSAVKVNARVLYVIINNRSYHILKTGLKALGAPLGADELDSLSLDGPADLLQIAEAFGVPGQRVSDPASLAGALETGLQAEGPYLLDISVSVP